MSVETHPITEDAHSLAPQSLGIVLWALYSGLIELLPHAEADFLKGHLTLGLRTARTRPEIGYLLLSEILLDATSGAQSPGPRTRLWVMQARECCEVRGASEPMHPRFIRRRLTNLMKGGIPDTSAAEKAFEALSLLALGDEPLTPQERLRAQGHVRRLFARTFTLDNAVRDLSRRLVRMIDSSQVPTREQPKSSC